MNTTESLRPAHNNLRIYSKAANEIISLRVFLDKY